MPSVNTDRAHYSYSHTVLNINDYPNDRWHRGHLVCLNESHMIGV